MLTANSTWRAAAIEMNGVDQWYVVDAWDDAQPVAIVPRGREVAEDICRMRDEVTQLRAACAGYRRDLDNCLAELKHKNRVLRDRDIAYQTLLERLAKERP